MNFKKLPGFILLIILSQTALGKIKLPAIISDNMVLQQQSSVPLWGSATENKRVTVLTSWDHKKYTAQCDAKGNWRIEIQTPAAGGPFNITFDDGSKLTINNILVGEVWVCSGQSNMEKPMLGGVNQPILNSNDILMHANDKKLRLFHVGRTVSNTPLNDCKGSWDISTPENASTFSAVGFQFAKQMQEILHVPVGIIEAAWGGTPIEGWMDRESLQSFSTIKIPASDDTKKADPHTPTCLFNGMINPILGFGIKGIIWYQGENNRRNPSMYADFMAAMVKGWREKWKSGTLPFYYVQIAPYVYGGALKDSVPFLREAQAHAAKIIPHSGMVVSMDVGNKYTIHPPNKTIIAKRLLYWALGDTYQWKGVAYKSPSFDTMRIKNNTVTVSFSQTPHGLTSFDEEIRGFEMAGNDKIFYPAAATIKGKGDVLLQCEQVAHPVAVRYLFKDWAEGNLFNTEGLPVAPFRTDTW